MARSAQVTLIVVLVLLAAVVNSVVLAPLDLPGSPPNVLLLVVAALALVLGPVGGAFIGFFAGLAADVLPPADHLIGRYALVLCLIGYLVGLLREEARDSVLLALVSVAIAAGIATVLYGLLGGVLSDGRVGAHALISTVPYSIVYDVILAPFVVPWIMSLARRTQPQVTHK
ncbi:MAG: rod shape-determining protein MreD [Acidothermaceae bacterium]